VQTTVDDFGGGSSSDGRVTNVSGGELELATLLDEHFDGAALDSDWVTNDWGGDSNFAVSNGALSIGGGQARSVTTFTNAPVIGRISFSNSPYQHFGVGSNLGDPFSEWVIFSTKDTTDRLSRASIQGNLFNIDLGPRPAGFHDFEIRPVTGGYEFHIDGALATTVAGTISSHTPLRVILSAYHLAPTLQADWIRVGSYASTGVYFSSVFDAGALANWGMAHWTAELPTGTSVTVHTRSGNVALPNEAVASPPGRYLQYRVTLTTSLLDESPVFYDWYLEVL
jgi:hypothetical protein